MDSPPSRVTLRDVADRVGVSVMTVSLALRGHPKIPATRRTEVRKAAEQMGYRPNPNAMALAQQRRHTMARPVCAELAWLNFWRQPSRLRGYGEFDLYWRGAVQAAEHHGFHLEELQVGSRLSPARVETILRSRNIQGLLVPPHGFAAGAPQPDQSSLDWSRYSVVRFGYGLPNLPAHVVAGNHVQGTFLACQKIRERGYTRIGYACYAHSSMRGKAGVFLFQMTDLPPEERLPVLVIEPHSNATTRLRKLEAWLRKTRPDAILSEIAELRAMLAKLGLEVPGDIALAATSVRDGNADAGIDQNSFVIGEAAVESLLELIYRNETGLPLLGRETLVNASWQDGSTLPLKTSADVSSCTGSV